MGAYDADRELAQELIREFGQEAILRRFPRASAPDPDRPWRRDGAAPDPVNYPVNAVFLTPPGSGERLSPGLDVQVGDQRVLIAALGTDVVPDITDRLYRNGGGADDEGFDITSVEVLDPAGDAILYDLRARR